MNYGDLKSHFNDLLNRSDITAALTTRFIDQGIARIERSTPHSDAGEGEKLHHQRDHDRNHPSH